MSAIMVVTMSLISEDWVFSYSRAVPDLLREYGARQIAGARDVIQLEGKERRTDRIAIFSFPSLSAIHAFMGDERYRPYRAAREKGADSEIFIFEDALSDASFV